MLLLISYTAQTQPSKFGWLTFANFSSFALPLHPKAAANARLTANASALMAANPKSSLPDYNSTEFASCWTGGGYGCGDVFEKWANQSLALAVKDAYAGAGQDFKPPQAYMVNAQDVSKHRITLGGYRLADVMTAVAVNLPSIREPVCEKRIHLLEAENVLLLAEIAKLKKRFEQ